MPQPLTSDGIEEIVLLSAPHDAHAARSRVVDAHAAHGYLIHEFLAPLRNQRSDDYGGSFENRTRLVVIVAAVRSASPNELPLILRISSTDWVDDGWGVDDRSNSPPIKASARRSHRLFLGRTFPTPQFHWATVTRRPFPSAFATRLESSSARSGWFFSDSSGARTRRGRRWGHYGS